MDSADDCCSLGFCLVFKHLANFQRCCTVETTRRFIAQEQIRIGNQLVAYTCSLTLSSRDSFYKLATDSGTTTVLETESLHNIVNFRLYFIWIQVCSKLGCESEGFFRGESFQKNIILLHKSSKFSKIVLSEFLVIDSNLSTKLASWTKPQPLPEHIQEGCLSTSTSTHNCHQLSWFCIPCDPMQYLFIFLRINNNFNIFT